MEDFTPDAWILMIFPENRVRIMSGWYGGYLGGEYWRLSSTVVSTTRKDDNILVVETETGSLYHLPVKYIGYTSLSGYRTRHIVTNLPEVKVIEDKQEILKTLMV